jgi:uncharacterized repeat protein (TIGR01451 family)
MILSWLRGFTKRRSPTARRVPSGSERGKVRPRLEFLEDRVVPASVDLSIVKMASAAAVVPGQAVTYTLTVTNNSTTSTTSSATVSDTLPTGLTLISATSANQGVTVTTSGNAVSATLPAAFAGGATATLTVLATASSTGNLPASLTDMATVAVAATDTDPNPANNTSSVTTTVNAVPTTAANLTVNKTGTPGTIVPGQLVTYTLTVTNSSTANPATNTVLTDVLPAGLTFIAETSTTPGVTFSQSGNVVTANLGTVTSAAPGTLTLTAFATTTTAGTLTDTATATTAAGVSNTATSRTTATTTLAAATAPANLTVTKMGSPGTVVTGQTVTYTIMVSNASAANPAAGTVVTDVLPAGLTFSSATTSQGSFTQSGGVVTFNLGPVVNGTPATLTVTATATAAGTLTDTATATTTAGVTTPANSRTTASTTVNPAATTTTVIASPTSVPVGQPVTFTASVTVNSPGSGTPTGTVNFLEGTNVIGSAPVDATGTATFTTSFASAGTHTVTASFVDGTNFQGSTAAQPAVVSATQAAPMFADMNQCFVNQVYRDLLNRNAEAGALASWGALLNQGRLTRTQVVLAIETSMEYRIDVVQNLYQRFLRRAADPGGLNAGVNFLAQGGTTSQLEAILLASNEYFMTRGGGTNAGWLAAVYQDVLGRAIEAAAVQSGTQALAAGVTRLQFAQAVINSQEGLTVEVQALYRQFLGRAADPGGLNAFVSALQAGQTTNASASDAPASASASDAPRNASASSARGGITTEGATAILLGSNEFFNGLTC